MGAQGARGRGAPRAAPADLRGRDERLDDHRRRREHVHRLHRRRRRAQRRPRAPAGRAGGAGAGVALPAHRLHGDPVRGLRRAGRAADRRVAVPRPREGGVLQRGHRGRRERRQVRARLHAPHRRRLLRGRLPRPDAAVADHDLEDAPVQGGPRPVRSRGLPPAVPRLVPRAEHEGGSRRAGGLVLDRRPGGAHRVRRDRAAARRGRLHARVAGVHGRPAQLLRPARDRARRRRGADRLRAHRARCGRSSTTGSSPT